MYCCLCTRVRSTAAHISVGALGDSFYEYLLKVMDWTSKADTEARDMYCTAMDVVEGGEGETIQEYVFFMLQCCPLLVPWRGLLCPLLVPWRGLLCPLLVPWRGLLCPLLVP